jgi:hypothetical protein
MSGASNANVGMSSGPAPGELSAQASYDSFWPKQIDEIRTMDLTALKRQELPLARDAIHQLLNIILKLRILVL